jgi:putative membrane protein
VTRSAILATLIGLGVAITLFASTGFAPIAEALLGAGWGILLVVALHTPQTLFSAFGWRALIDEERAPGLWLLYRLRWIRESVNALLPVAQIGGDFVRAHLLSQRGTSLKTAVASSMVDLSVELMAQIAFTLICVGLLLTAPHIGNVVPSAIAATAAGGLIAAAFMASQRFGLFKLVELAIARSAASKKWAFLGGLTDLNDAVVALYRQPRRIWASGAYHLISWALGALETWAALKVLGLAAGLRDATIIEGLGQAVRGLGFFIPAALGVQEGGYLLICAAVSGISPQDALALSLIRRIRELALGVPGLILWHRMKSAHEARKSATAEALIP